MQEFILDDILSTLSYYDIFQYPLTADEVYGFLPVKVTNRDRLKAALIQAVMDEVVYEHNGYFSISSSVAQDARRRIAMEKRAGRRWKTARAMTHILKRFPFVSSVIVTGTLSKNIHQPGLDIDYFIITEPNRLWIARTLLIGFKKIVLLNSRDLFCLNYFISSNALEVQDKNVFTATEIAHAKVLYNSSLFADFLHANRWIYKYFPNLNDIALPSPNPDEKKSRLRMLSQRLFDRPAFDELDERLMRRWADIWKRRYPDLPDDKRDALFRVRRHESKAHGPDFQTRILAAHAERCKAAGINPSRYQTHKERAYEHPAFA